MPQSRKRVYILMVRRDLCSTTQVKAIVQTIRKILPSVFDRRETLADVQSYVGKFGKLLGENRHLGLNYPERAQAGMAWNLLLLCLFFGGLLLGFQNL